MELLKTCKKGWHMNILQNFYIQQHYQKGTLMNEQHPGKENPLFKIINPTTYTGIYATTTAKRANTNHNATSQYKSQHRTRSNIIQVFLNI
jgi:hypothetical protein